MNSRQKTVLLLTLILALALGARLHNLDKEDIWLDEEISLEFSSYSISDLITGNARDPGHPPLFPIILKGWRYGFGDSLLSLRILPLIFSMLSVLMMYLTSRKIFDRKIALLSSLLIATSMIQVVYAQEIRAYSLISFLFLLLAYLFIDIAKTGRRIALFSALLALSIYIHYIAILLFLAANIIFFALARKNQKLWIISQSLVLLIITPILLPMLGAITIIISLLIRAFQEIPLIRIGLALGIISASLAAFSILHSKSIRKTILRGSWFFTLYPLFLFIAGILYFLFIETIMGHDRMFLLRYSLPFFPIIYLATAIWLRRIPAKAALASIFLILLFNSYAIATYYTTTTKQEWSIAADYISTHEKPQDTILIDAGYAKGVFDHHYSGERKSIPLSPSFNRTENIRNLTQTLDGIGNPETIWLVLAHNWRTGYLYYDLLIDLNYMQEEHLYYTKLEIIKMTYQG